MEEFALPQAPSPERGASGGQNLALVSAQNILPGRTLIIFDEIQGCPQTMNSLKYLCENASEYHVACAGSLLGVALAQPSSFPVGQVNFMTVNPMTFSEFLLTNGDSRLLNVCALVNCHFADGLACRGLAEYNVEEQNLK